MESLVYPFTRSWHLFCLLKFPLGKGVSSAPESSSHGDAKASEGTELLKARPQTKICQQLHQWCLWIGALFLCPYMNFPPTPYPLPRKRGGKYPTREKRCPLSLIPLQKVVCDYFPTCQLTEPILGPGCNWYGFCAKKWVQPQSHQQRKFGASTGMLKAMGDGASERIFERWWNGWAM